MVRRVRKRFVCRVKTAKSLRRLFCILRPLFASSKTSQCSAPHEIVERAKENPLCIRDVDVGVEGGALERIFFPCLISSSKFVLAECQSHIKVYTTRQSGEV